MGIRVTTPQDEINNFLSEAASVLRREILTALIKLGEECIVKIRDRSPQESWIDHTGNLRSSIGYAVYDNAVKVIQSDFQQVLGGTQGPAKGQAMIAELAKSFSKTYALVVVAGMEYADRVEAIESKDVLESTRIWAEAQIEARLKTAKDAAMEKINRLMR